MKKIAANRNYGLIASDKKIAADRNYRNIRQAGWFSQLFDGIPKDQSATGPCEDAHTDGFFKGIDEGFRMAVGYVDTVMGQTADVGKEAPDFGFTNDARPALHMVRYWIDNMRQEAKSVHSGSGEAQEPIEDSSPPPATTPNPNPSGAGEQAEPGPE